MRMSAIICVRLPYYHYAYFSHSDFRGTHEQTTRTIRFIMLLCNRRLLSFIHWHYVAWSGLHLLVNKCSENDGNY